MSKLIEGRVGNMRLTTLQLFHNLTDEDFLYIHEQGQLKTLCMALSLDLHQKKTQDEAEC